jgi:hypothetical protein
MYLIIKTSQEEIDRQGSLFEAARGHWRIDPDRASTCSHAVIALIGQKDIKAVYKMDKWYPSTLIKDRHVFAGEQDPVEEKKLVGKTLNSKWRAKGLENPILYSEETELLEV